MATTSVFSLTAFTSLASGDVLAVVDVSDLTQSAHGSLDKITVTNFFATIPVPVIVTSTSTQLQLKYDGSNHVTVAVSSAGAVTLNATGASAGFTFSDPVTVTTAGTSIASNTTAAAANFNALYKAQRSGSTFWWLALDASDQFSLLNAAGNANNLVVTDAGALTVRAGVTATTGTFSGAVGSSAFTATTVNVTGDGELNLLNATSAAGALTGTLTNAPTTGNPSFWLKIHINGNLRSIPCWG